jgi:hypothetical protein
MAPSQRKKKEKAAETSSLPPTTTTTTTSTSSQAKEKMSLTEQLDRAQASVEGNQQTALNLHRQWRAHLLRLSMVVMIVTFHQAQQPTTNCVTEIKQWNEIKKNSMEDTITGWQTITAVLTDSVSELLAIICVGCLLWCLCLPMAGTDFSTLPYRLSCACLPIIVRIYFSNKDNTSGCLNDGGEMEQYYQTIEDPPERPPRPFPIILIFHTIVSICLFFMQFQVKQHTHNIEMVLKLKKDLMDARKKK